MAAIVVSQTISRWTGNEKIVNVEGDTNVDTRWLIEVFVGDLKPIAFIA